MPECFKRRCGADPLPDPEPHTGSVTHSAHRSQPEPPLWWQEPLPATAVNAQGMESFCGCTEEAPYPPAGMDSRWSSSRAGRMPPPPQEYRTHVQSP